MLLEEEKIAQVFNCVTAVVDYMRNFMHEPAGLILSIDALKEAVEKVCDIQVEMHEVTFIGEHVGGTTERYDDKRARILVKSGQSPEMMRLIATKELCHVLIDEADSWSTNGAETIRGLLREWELNKNGDHTSPASPLQSEMLAEIAAIELLYPFEFRESDLRKLANNETTVSKIALDHEAPAWSIDQALTHHETFEQCWKLMAEKKAA